MLEKVHTEHYDGDATNELILKNFPVSEITSLNQDPERVFGATTAINVSADVLADKTSGVLRLWNNETRFTRGSGNVKIVYKAGYLLADVPTEVKLAVLEIIALNYKRYQEGKFHVKSETVGQMNTAFSDDDIPKSARTVLDMYRAHGVSGYAF